MLFFFIIPFILQVIGDITPVISNINQEARKKYPANVESVRHNSCEIPFILIIPVSLPLKFCSAAHVWLLSLHHLGVISSPFFLNSSPRAELNFSPCVVICRKVSARSSVNFLLRYICSHLGRPDNNLCSQSLPMKVEASVSHRNLIN